MCNRAGGEVIAAESRDIRRARLAYTFAGDCVPGVQFTAGLLTGENALCAGDTGEFDFHVVGWLVVGVTGSIAATG
jgi:hypothetical protein